MTTASSRPAASRAVDNERDRWLRAYRQMVRIRMFADQPAVRPMMMLTVSCDHRVADGARAALFLSDLAEAIRNPAKTLQ